MKIVENNTSVYNTLDEKEFKSEIQKYQKRVTNHDESVLIKQRYLQKLNS